MSAEVILVLALMAAVWTLAVIFADGVAFREVRKSYQHFCDAQDYKLRVRAKRRELGRRADEALERARRMR